MGVRKDADKLKEQFIGALKAGYGIITTACEAVGISRTLLYQWLDSDEDFKMKVDEVTEMQVDFVESKLLKNISEGDTTAIIFYLKTKGKKRGYTDKIMPERKKNMPQGNALPDLSVTDKKLIERKIKSKRSYIVKILKEQGKYTKELTYQVAVTAQLLVRTDILRQELMRDGYNSVNVEYSREGNERLTINPKEKLYVEALENAQKALRALGMNTESKTSAPDTNSGLDDLINRVKSVEEEE